MIPAAVALMFQERIADFPLKLTTRAIRAVSPDAADALRELQVVELEDPSGPPH